MNYKKRTLSKSNKMYLAWRNAKARCQSTSYKEKGITYPKSWGTFQGFVSKMQEDFNPRLYFLRKDIDAPFSTSNCFWSQRVKMTLSQQTAEALKYKGVYRCSNPNGKNIYRAYWNDPITEKRKYKIFSESKYGSHALNLAIELRINTVPK